MFRAITVVIVLQSVASSSIVIVEFHVGYADLGRAYDRERESEGERQTRRHLATDSAYLRRDRRISVVRNAKNEKPKDGEYCKDEKFIHNRVDTIYTRYF